MSDWWELPSSADFTGLGEKPLTVSNTIGPCSPAAPHPHQDEMNDGKVVEMRDIDFLHGTGVCVGVCVCVCVWYVYLYRYV